MAVYNMYHILRLVNSTKNEDRKQKKKEKQNKIKGFNHIYS